MAIERYVSVCHPHYVGFSEAGKLSVAGVILFSVVFNINRFFEYTTQTDIRVSFFSVKAFFCSENVFPLF